MGTTVRAFRRRGSLPAALAITAAIPLAIAAAAPAGDIPSLDQAVKQEIHGIARLRKKQIQVQYDFRKPEQGKDFTLDRLRGFVVFGPGTAAQPAPAPESPTVEPGRLVLPPTVWLVCDLPLAEIHQVSLTATGANGYSLRLRGGKDQVTVNFAANPSISFDDGLGIGDSKRNLKLAPTDRYEFSVEIRGGKAIGKLDGKLLVEEPLPEGMGALDTLFFGPSIMATATETPVHVSGIAIAGVIADALPLIAANRGRGSRSEPPVWEETHTSAGKHVTVTTPESAAEAERWSERLDGIVLRLLADYPLGPAPEGGGDVPADRKAPPFEYSRTVHLFTDADVLAAYRGSRLPFGDLPNGDFALLDRADDGAAAREWTVQWTIAAQALERFYAAAPWWWSAGNSALVALDAGRDPADPNVPPAYVAKAMNHLGRGIEPRLSDIVRGWSPGKSQEAPVEVAWAWVHFLRHGDGGTHAPLLRRFHEELRLGRSGPEASQLVFPTEVFDDLYASFQKHLKSLAPAK